MIEPKKEIKNLQGYLKPDKNRRTMIRFDHNENARGRSPYVIKSIRKAAVQDVSVYPETDILLKNLAEYYKVSEENIILTAGSDDGIRCIFEAYVSNNDKVILPDSTFSMYPVYCKQKGAAIELVKYNKDFSFPLKQFIETITANTKMLVLVNPGSPAGTSITRENVIEILRKAPNSVVVLDEAYAHYMKRTDADLVKDYSNLFVVKTFSKAFGLAGLRLGYILSAEENIAHLKSISMPYCVNSLAVIAGNAALEDIHFLESVVKKHRLRKKVFSERTRENRNIFMYNGYEFYSD